MKILVIFTGGTIGSAVEGDYISTSSDAPFKLLSMYKAQSDRDVEFITREPFTLLSENLTGEYLQKLGSNLKAELNGGYDGIIITHGSDTVQYSAAAMSYLLPDIDIPVLLVSSNRVLDDPEATGIPNFSAAVEFIYAKAGKGVFLPNMNHDGIVYIHRGNRALAHMAYTDEIFSVDDQYYGLIDEYGNYSANPKYIPSPAGLPLHLEMPEKWDSGILWITPAPGMRYPSLNPDSTKAILLSTYHSGTLCSGTPGMGEFFNRASALGIPVFLTGASAGPDYDSVREWENMNIDVLPPTSPVAAYIKLWMAMSSRKLLQEHSLSEIMHAAISDDIITA